MTILPASHEFAEEDRSVFLKSALPNWLKPKSRPILLLNRFHRGAELALPIINCPTLEILLQLLSVLEIVSHFRPISPVLATDYNISQIIFVTLNKVTKV